ncbi:MFS general substrate transporter [Cadophora sp. DSE1049]|nr:MFS general substrate transporter [Cadophora sp. DSE1049]
MRDHDDMVEFEENDPRDPKIWFYSRKWVATTLVSFISFVTAASSSIVAPGLPQIATELMIPDPVEKSLVFAIFGFGFIVGALPYGPLSELYGRAPVLHVSYFVFFVFNLASGFANTKAQLLIFRILAGVGGSAPNTIGAGVVSDCFNAEDIGRGSAFYGLAPRLGPAVGPLVGGFIVQNLGWRWSFHITSMLAGVLFIFALIFVQETRPQIILERKAKKLGKELVGMMRPLVYLGTHRIVQYLAVYQFFIAGTLYLVLSTFHGLWIESWTITFANVSNPMIPRIPMLASRPEHRAPLMIIGCVVYPIGFLLFGWSAQYRFFWLVPNVGIFFVSVGIIIISQGIKLCTLSAYGDFAASAQGAVNFTPAIDSGTFPLFAPYMLQKLRYGWTGTVLAVVAMIIGIPRPIILWYYGPRLRKKAGGLQKEEGELISIIFEGDGMRYYFLTAVFISKPYQSAYIIKVEEL